MKNQTDFGTKLASLVLIFSMLGNDVIASTRAVINYSSESVGFAEKEPFFSVVHNRSEKPALKNDSAPDEGKPALKSEVHLRSKSITYLGNHLSDPLGRPEDDFVEFNVPADFRSYKNVVLEYDIQGLEQGLNLPKSINGLPVFYGEAMRSGEKWQRVSLQLNTDELTPGLNSVRFSLPAGFPGAVTVKGVNLILTNENSTAPLMHRIEREEASIEDFHIEDVIGDEKFFELESMDMPSIPTDIRNVTKGADGYLLEYS